jgi:hypothetical protein
MENRVLRFAYATWVVCVGFIKVASWEKRLAIASSIFEIILLAKSALFVCAVEAVWIAALGGC